MDRHLQILTGAMMTYAARRRLVAGGILAIAVGLRALLLGASGRGLLGRLGILLVVGGMGLPFGVVASLLRYDRGTFEAGETQSGYGARMARAICGICAAPLAATVAVLSHMTRTMRRLGPIVHQATERAGAIRSVVWELHQAVSGTGSQGEFVADTSDASLSRALEMLAELIAQGSGGAGH